MLTPPKVLIAYARQDDPCHLEWLQRFAGRLRANGVDALLDKWELAPGDACPKFMEDAVHRSDFVLLICTPEYKKRSDERKGGVGYEAHLMASEVADGGTRRKFIPILLQGSRSDSVPLWAKGCLCIDFRSDNAIASGFSELLDTLHGCRKGPPEIYSSVASPEPPLAAPKNPKPLYFGRSLRRLILSLSAVAAGLVVSALSYSAYATNIEVTAETQVTLATLICEASHEAAIDSASLEFTRRQFLEMVQIATIHLESLQSHRLADSGFLAFESRRTEVITGLRSVAAALKTADAQSTDHGAAISEARKQLRQISGSLDGDIPLAIAIDRFHTGNARASPQFVDKLSIELDLFEKEIDAFASDFPSRQEPVPREYLAKLVYSAEAVCQQSRLAFLLISLEWESREANPDDSELIHRFIALEKRARKQCASLRDYLPDGDQKSHMKKLTEERDRRLETAKAYRDRNWAHLMELLTESFGSQNSS